MVALIELLGGPAVIVGNSIGAGSAVLAFPGPRAEAAWIAHAVSAQVVMVSVAGQDPQSQQPAVTTGAILRFLKSVTGHA